MVGDDVIFFLWLNEVYIRNFGDNMKTLYRLTKLFPHLKDGYTNDTFQMFTLFYTKEEMNCEGNIFCFHSPHKADFSQFEIEVT